MERCDYAISFQRDIDHPRHIRIPNWVQRFHANGIHPEQLLQSHRIRDPEGEEFCAFLYGNHVPFREAFVRMLSARRRVNCPGRSVNNMPPIGPTSADKERFLRAHRFCIAFENAVSPGIAPKNYPRRSGRARFPCTSETRWWAAISTPTPC